ncbi:MAG TPA: class I SAM-dependent methyltransferase [Jiangellaceae bacterium]|nr:class I SAM-dependent methyltransferase [Jiangellaceae bacterium]
MRYQRAPSLRLTGERTVPGLPHENYWFRRHEAAYVALAPLCERAAVLEAGCGAGYGAAVALEAGASTVVALDYDADAVEHTHGIYGVPAVRGNLVALPFAAGSFDVVLSLQTLEHLWDQRTFLTECARVLRPGGRLALTTPNRLTFPPGNPFHAHELDATELTALVGTGPFRIETLDGLRHTDRIVAFEAGHGDFVAAQLATEPAGRPADLTAFVAAVTVDDFLLSGDDIDASLDLQLVAVRR